MAAADLPLSLPHPRETLDLLGHEAAEQEILETCAAGRVAHAWLISGPQGIGKATLAYRFARFVLSGGLERLSGQAPRGDGEGGGGLFGEEALPVALAPGAGLGLDAEHPTVRRVIAGSHGDLRVIERAIADEKTGKRKGEIVVGDVRGLSTYMAMTPSEGGWRVVIVDEAEMMNRNAANALLKNLEEPPGRALMLLVSHNPARLLPTIRSRCRRLPLTPLPDAAVDQLLNRHLPDLAPADRQALVGLAEGSIGRALALAEQGGLAVCRDMLALLADLPRCDVARLHALGDQAARDDQAWEALGTLLPWWLARMVRAGAMGGAHGAFSEGDTPGLPGEAACARRLLAAAPLDRWVEVWEKVCDLFARARAVHMDRKQTVLSAFFEAERAVARA